MKINSVTGPVDTAELGTTLMHEHVCCADWSMRANFGKRIFEFDKVVDTAVTMFRKMKNECGVTTVVDGTPINLGRDVKLVREVAVRSGIRFIVSSGFYYQEEPALAYLPEDKIADLLLGECKNGIDGTDILPGIMKAAIESAEITPYLHKVLGAVAHTAAQTGLPVFCHHKPLYKNGGKILDLFESHGVAPNKFILGHSGDSDDLVYLKEMLDRGCYIGMDRFGYCDMGASLEKRVATISSLCDKGYAHRMLLSHDLLADLALFGGDDALKNSNPEERSPDFTFIHKSVLPALLASGVTQDRFNTMMTQNPRSFFNGE